jgi:hypothetical protein
MMLSASACGRNPPAIPVTGDEPSIEATEETTSGETSEETASGESSEETTSGDSSEGETIDPQEFEDLLDLDPNNFDNSTIIDNEWFPLKPGMQFTYEGYTADAGERVPHKIVFIVTDLTKMIDDVRVVVILDADYADDRLEEKELTFFAQDNDGNVWHLGQYRETYDETEFVGGRIWRINDPEGSKAGIMMQAEPQLEMPSYSQGYAPPPFNWTDRAQVYQMGEKTTVPFGSYDDVLVVEEFNQEEPGAFQLKYYARGVGNVRIGWRGDDSQQEEMGLVDLVELDADALAEARADALELENRAYIYGRTQPAEQEQNSQ